MSHRACSRLQTTPLKSEMPNMKRQISGNHQRGIPQSPQCNRKGKVAEAPARIEELFNGTLGDWDCNPVSLQLKEGAQPYHDRPFPIPKKHADNLKKEIQRLCILGLMKWQADSKWALPTFIIPKKDNNV